jgi:uncharacterized membrane protein
MTHDPVSALPADSAAPTGGAVVTAKPSPTSGVAPPRIPRPRAALTVIAGMAGVGVLIGALWGWVAPSVHGVIALTRSGERVQTYLGNEADHFFVSAFMMLGLLSVLSVVGSVLVWQWRAHRGPLMVAAVSLGAITAAVAATTVGALLARVRYPVVDIDTAPVTPDHRVHYFAQAPSVFFGHTPLQMATTLLVPAATAALVYALFTVSTVRDDLGAYPPVDAPRLVPLPESQPVTLVQPETSPQVWSDPQRSNRDSGNRSS